MFYTLLKIQRFIEACYQTLISILRVLLRFNYRNGLKKHRVEKDKLIVLGNGPSLKESLAENLTFMDGAKKMAVNQFVFSDAFSVLKPEY